MSAGGAAADQSEPSPTGVWSLTDEFDNVPSSSPYYIGYDSVMFAPTAPDTYTVTIGSANGGGTSNVPASGSSFTLWTCGASASGAIYSETDEGACPASSGYFIESWQFDYSTNPYTASGSFQQYGAGGSTAGMQYGTFTAVGPAATREPSDTTVTCIHSGLTTPCTAMVADAGSAGLTPTGTVTFDASAGSFATKTCTLTATTGGAACSEPYTFSASGSAGVQVTATYGGDDAFSGSSGVGSILCGGSSDASVRSSILAGFLLAHGSVGQCSSIALSPSTNLKAGDPVTISGADWSTTNGPVSLYYMNPSTGKNDLIATATVNSNGGFSDDHFKPTFFNQRSKYPNLSGGCQAVVVAKQGGYSTSGAATSPGIGHIAYASYGGPDPPFETGQVYCLGENPITGADAHAILVTAPVDSSPPRGWPTGLSDRGTGAECQPTRDGSRREPQALAVRRRKALPGSARG